MTNDQQLALELVAGRALTNGEKVALEPLLTIRNDVAIASILSVGRKRVVSRPITERGVRASLSVPMGSRFIVAIKAMQHAEPQWLSPTLSLIGVPSSDHDTYYETLSCAYGWLTQEAGLDVGSTTARGMLDLIAAGDPSQAAAIAIIKSLAEVDDPINFHAVSTELNRAEGRMTF